MTEHNARCREPGSFGRTKLKIARGVAALALLLAAAGCIRDPTGPQQQPPPTDAPPAEEQPG